MSSARDTGTAPPLRVELVRDRSRTETVHPVFRIAMVDERLAKVGGGTTLPMLVPTRSAASVRVIKPTVCQLVATDQALVDPSLFEQMMECGVRASIGVRHSVANLAPNRTLEVGMRYNNQHLSNACWSPNSLTKPWQSSRIPAT